MLSVCLILIFSTKAYAAVPTYSHKMIGGISDIYIYIDDKEQLKATYWQNLIQSAVNNWMYTGVGANQFYALGYVSSGTSGSKIDFYARPANYFGIFGDEILGMTSYWSYDIRAVDPLSSDWYSAQIDVNDTLLRHDSISDHQAIGLFAHEIGHAFGLRESNDPYSIMYYTTFGRAVWKVQKVDNDALNSLY